MRGATLAKPLVYTPLILLLIAENPNISTNFILPETQDLVPNQPAAEDLVVGVRDEADSTSFDANISDENSR